MKKLLIIISIIIFSNLIIAQSNYKLVEKENSASCFVFSVIDKYGEDVILPEKINDALDCPSIINLSGNVLTYEFENAIWQYNVDNQKNTMLFKNYDDIDGCSNPAWSKDKSKVMFVIVNQEMKHNYKALCRIIVITLNDKGEPINKQKFDRNVNFVCGNICSSSPKNDFWFVNNKTIEYRLHEAYENEFPTEKIMID